MFRGKCASPHNTGLQEAWRKITKRTPVATKVKVHSQPCRRPKAAPGRRFSKDLLARQRSLWSALSSSMHYRKVPSLRLHLRPLAGFQVHRQLDNGSMVCTFGMGRSGVQLMADFDHCTFLKPLSRWNRVTVFSSQGLQHALHSLQVFQRALKLQGMQILEAWLPVRQLLMSLDALLVSA